MKQKGTVTMADVRLQMGYEAAINSLTTQTEEMSRVRSQALGILGVTTITNSILISAGLLRIPVTSQASHSALPTWSAWPILGFLVAIGILTMAIHLQPRDWTSAPTPTGILDKQKFDINENILIRTITEEMITCHGVNHRSLSARKYLLQVSIFLLLTSLTITLVAFAQ